MATRAAHVRYRARIDLRTHWWQLVVYGLLVGTVTGGLLACVAGARRTDTAFARLREATNSADLYVVPVCSPTECESGPSADEVARLEAVPGVEAAIGLHLWSGEFTHEDGRVLQSSEETSTSDLVLLASADPRLGTEVNEQIVVAGRRADPAAADEAVVHRDAADSRGVRLGDRVRVEYEVSAGATSAERELVVEIVGITLEAAGVRTPGGEVYVSGIIGTPALVAAQRSSETGLAVRLAPGRDASVLAGTPWEEGVFLDLDDNEAAIGSGTDDDSLVLMIIALVGAVGSLLVLGPVVGNAALSVQRDASTMRALGFTRRDAMRRSAIHGLALAGAVFVVALICAVALSAFTPIGEARRFEPDRGIAVDVPVLAIGAGLGAALAAAIVAAAVWRGSRFGRSAAPGRTRLPRLLGAGHLGVTTSLGQRIALGRVGAGTSGLGAMIAVALSAATGVGALVFVAGLDRLRHDERLVGVDYDLMLLYSDEEFDPTWARAQVERLLADDRVEGASAGTLFPPSDLTVDGAPTWVVGYVAGPRGSPAFVVAEGRAPVAAHEILLHPDLLADVGSIGDVVPVEVSEFSVDFTIVGSGVVATADMFKVTSVITIDGFRRIEEALGVDDESVEPYAVTASFADGLDRDETTAALLRDGVIDEDHLLRPPERDRAAEDVVGLDLGGADRAPRALSALLAVLGAVVLALSVTDRARAWRHRLAIHRALGLSSLQSRAAVTLSSVITAAVCVLLALPLGIAAGRATWARHAENLGVIVEVPIPWAWIAIAIGCALAVAAVVALRPAFVAGRQRVLRSLRAE